MFACDVFRKKTLHCVGAELNFSFYAFYNGILAWVFRPVDICNGTFKLLQWRFQSQYLVCEIYSLHISDSVGSDLAQHELGFVPPHSG